MVPLRWGRTWIVVLFAVLAGWFPPGGRSALALENGDCFDCHGDREILSWSAEERTSNVVAGGEPAPARNVGPFPGISLHVDPDAYRASVHADLSCTDCHADIERLPHRERVDPVDCSACHAEVAAVYAKSLHVVNRRRTGGLDSPRCSDCHGAHAIPKSSVSTSPVYFRNLAATCTRCHGSKEVTARAGIAMPRAAEMYERSIHNRAIVDKGLNKSATCVDCHGSHDLKDRFDPSSPIFRRNVPETCGKCHYGVLTIFRDSVHGVAFYRGVPDAPGCTDCHGEHEIRQADDPRSRVSFMAVSKTTCPSCHAAERLADRYGVETAKVKGYRDSFHGLSQRLGDRTAANCASCHGFHDILPASDPASSVNRENLPRTCGKCHPNAGANFARGNVHVEVAPGKATGVFAVRLFYTVFISVLVLLFVLHVGMDLLGRRRRAKGTAGKAKE